MQSNLEAFGSNNIQVVGISYDEASILKSFSEENGITFPLLSDPTSQVIRAFQLFDDRESGKYRGVPVPTTVVVDSQKKVCLIVADTIKKRHAGRELVKQINELN